jgi:hypothetical protein
MLHCVKVTKPGNLLTLNGIDDPFWGAICNLRIASARFSAFCRAQISASNFASRQPS